MGVDEFIGKIVNYEPSVISIYGQNRQLVVEEPSLIAYDVEAKKALAVGRAAKNMIGAGGVVVGSPFKRGVVADFDRSRMLVQDLIRSHFPRLLIKPKIALFSNQDLTMVDYKAFSELLLVTGARTSFWGSPNYKIIEGRFQDKQALVPPSFGVIIEITYGE